ncbi:hypothetical protein QCE62_19755 [Caballeronia sp. LZ033]|uniref:hypothetical protein n=1 Tax=Caballeronia sp. LZ033 TaxID=3038566 RepID=UPI00285EA51F|nr:hypothetical protein [Caballeronia sp. LZ033]MDR5815826.1 hypothetical protein [Caballeronia sp. LZ033]
MKIAILYAAASLLCMCNPASAQSTEPWRSVSTTLFVLQSQEKADLLLGANVDSRTNDMTINLFDFGGKICHDGQDEPVSSATPISINGQLVRFISGCINGTRILQPSSARGKKFLNDAVASGQPVVLDEGFNRPLHYPGTNTSAIRGKLRAARDAM